MGSKMRDTGNPSLDDTTILRPHLQSWKPCDKALDMEEADELHDPDADREDERWVEKNLSNGNALSLSCLGCFTQLCYQAQKHDSYEQYRALQVYLCKFDKNITLTQDDGEAVHPVRCDVCNAEVAVVDKDEVYHFFNVIPSSAILT